MSEPKKNTQVMQKKKKTGKADQKKSVKRSPTHREEDSSLQQPDKKERTKEPKNDGYAKRAFITLVANEDVCLYGSCRLRVLVGSVVVNGYLLTCDDDRWIPIVAPLCASAATVQPVVGQKRVKLKQAMYHLKRWGEAWQPYFPPVLKKKALSIIAVQSNNDVRNYPLLPNFFTPGATESGSTLKPIVSGLWKAPSDVPVMIIPPSWVSLADRIVDILRHPEQEAPRIVIVGPRRSGKTTLGTYLHNRVLSSGVSKSGDGTYTSTAAQEHALAANTAPAPSSSSSSQSPRSASESVLWLDTDIGQSVFSPPGLLSLSRASMPLLVPAWTQAWYSWPGFESLSQRLMGSTSPEPRPDLYHAHVTSLASEALQAMQRGPRSPLIVNTHGWIVGLGLQLLLSVCNAIQPTHVIELCRDPRYPNSPFKEYFDSLDGAHVQPEFITLESPMRPKPVRSCVPKELRAVAFMHYFDVVQKPLPFCTMIRVPWVHFRLYAFAKREVPPSQLLCAMNGAMVGLLQDATPDTQLVTHPVDPIQWGNDDDPVSTVAPQHLPILVAYTPTAPCLGLAVVRAIDPVARCFYLVTPLTRDQVESCNTLVLTSIAIPISMLFATGTTNVPYTTHGSLRSWISKSRSNRRHLARGGES